MAHRSSLLLAATAAAALLAPAHGFAQAQNAGADRRMDRLEQSVRALQTAVQQAQATGQPVVVRPEGPDPVLTAMQDRVGDLEATIQRLNGQIENLGFELEEARRTASAAEADRQTALLAQTERLQRLEAQIAALAGPTDPIDPAAAAPGAPPPPPPAAAPPPAANAAEAFTQARALLTANDYEAAGRAFEDFVARYPTSARAPEAYYWLGESYFARRGYQTATAAYANALKARPPATTAWAPAAMARLGQALAFSGQNAQACAALAEFDKTYAARASAAVKGYAETARTRARCR